MEWLMFESKIIADSFSEAGKRITTLQLTFPRSILSEFNTHRNFSRNSASSRAIPIYKVISMVNEEPYIPVFTKKKSGMQGIEASDDLEFQEKTTKEWLI